MAAALRPDTVRVRWLTVDAEDASDLARWRGMLDADERARADRFRFPADRTIYTAAHALARFMLSQATGMPTAAWRYVVGEFGKPTLAADLANLDLHFNISHTRGLVACAIACQPIGVDVERSDRTVTLEVAQRFFAPEEVQILGLAPPGQEMATFFRFWSLKEAFIKATGEGLRRPLDSFSFCLTPLRVKFHPDRNDRASCDDPDAWRFWEWQPAKTCVAALAVRSARSNGIAVDAGFVNAADVRPL